MAALLELPRGARILELGGGPGATRSPVARHLAPSRLAGIDLAAGVARSDHEAAA